MSGRTHAMVPAALIATLFNADPVLTLTAAFAGLAPDIDEPWSVIGTRLWFLAWWMKYLFGHRTISHSLLMVVAVVIVGIVALMPIKMVVAVSIGLTSHLILDAFCGGIQLWWPKQDRWVLGRYPVYGTMDQVLLVLAMVVTVGCLLMRVGEEVKSASDDGQQSAQVMHTER